jgi:predicted site-specific integrase-resolvase
LRTGCTRSPRTGGSGKGSSPSGATRVGGLILIDQPASTVSAGVTVVYGCVSSADQRQDLERQVARVATWATTHDLAVDRVVTEVGSALNGHHRKLLTLLGDLEVTTVVVEHPGRFARFGAEYVEAVLSASGRRLLVVDPAEVDDDLVRDQAEILTSLCARLYGRRDGANRAARAAAAIEQDVP